MRMEVIRTRYPFLNGYPDREAIEAYSSKLKIIEQAIDDGSIPSVLLRQKDK